MEMGFARLIAARLRDARQNKFEPHINLDRLLELADETIESLVHENLSMLNKWETEAQCMPRVWVESVARTCASADVRTHAVALDELHQIGRKLRTFLEEKGNNQQPPQNVKPCEYIALYDCVAVKHVDGNESTWVFALFLEWLAIQKALGNNIDVIEIRKTSWGPKASRPSGWPEAKRPLDREEHMRQLLCNIADIVQPQPQVRRINFQLLTEQVRKLQNDLDLANTEIQKLRQQLEDLSPKQI